MPGYVKTILKIALSALSLWLVFRQVDVRQVWAVLTKAQVGWLLAATGLFIGSKFLSAERLRLLFARVGVSIKFWPHLKLYWVGMYYNLFLPGGIGGDGYKVYLLNRLTSTPVKLLIQATLLDRLLGLLPLLFLLLLLAAWLLPSLWMEMPSLAGMASPSTATILLTVGILIALGYVLGHWLLRRLMPSFAPDYHRTVAQSLGVQMAQAFQVLALVAALGAEGSSEAYLLVFLVSSIVATIPFTIGGAGARELTFLYGARLFHLPVDAAVAVSLLFYLITAFVSLTGAAFSFSSSTLTNDLTT